MLISRRVTHAAHKIEHRENTNVNNGLGGQQMSMKLVEGEFAQTDS